MIRRIMRGGRGDDEEGPYIDREIDEHLQRDGHGRDDVLEARHSRVRHADIIVLGKTWARALFIEDVVTISVVSDGIAVVAPFDVELLEVLVVGVRTHFHQNWFRT